MCAILQLVSAPLNPIPIVEHFSIIPDSDRFVFVTYLGSFVPAPCFVRGQQKESDNKTSRISKLLLKSLKCSLHSIREGARLQVVVNFRFQGLQ